MSNFDPIRFAIAFVPLAAYLLVMGLTNCRRKPIVTSGASEIFALGLGLTGLVFVGPIELFRPELATAQFLNYIWFVLLALYLLWVTLAAMISRPRLVVYNITPDELRPLLSEAASVVDASFRWAGDCLCLPRIGVQLHIDGFALFRNTSLVSSGPHQSIEGWHRLAKQLRANLRGVSSAPHPPAALLLSAAIVLLIACEMRIYFGTEEQLAEALNELFSFGWQRG
ncbi:hypothetical protein [Aeoliella mucimassa]|uniref:Uncharacterized protein n=1 Tax=Aeoliella mucimassa TaxID=2527972 RepID=A0A518AUR7_9BACT|nr:hypothetical protein [Aeoliella mucimassa]QDU58465.1 hypothetical protein Pan181_47020 [Aeoliella mucimassa]